jgi:hypothetical protein
MAGRNQRYLFHPNPVALFDTIIRAQRLIPPYSLTRFSQEEASTAERIYEGNTTKDQQKREDEIRRTLEELGRRLKDESPIHVADDKMMMELATLEKGCEVR